MEKEKVEFSTHNDLPEYIDELAHGTCLQGKIIISYNKLVEVFGKPKKVCGDKVIFEWTIIFEREDSKSVVATIYDWKEDCSPDRIRNLDKYDWHIGGHDYSAVEEVYNALGL